MKRYYISGILIALLPLPFYPSQHRGDEKEKGGGVLMSSQKSCKDRQSENVMIKTGRGNGSGSVINGRYVLTNHHVVKKVGESGSVVFDDGKKLSYRIIGDNAKVDLALLELQGIEQPLPSLSFATEKIASGSYVCTISSPKGRFNTLAEGSVIKSGQIIRSEIFVDFGSSGSPLMDKNGDIVGVTRSKPNGSTSTSIAIALEDVKTFVSTHLR